MRYSLFVSDGMGAVPTINGHDFCFHLSPGAAQAGAARLRSWLCQCDTLR